jgi:hypothetical protein
VISPDETGWRVGALPAWLWAFAATSITVYAIGQGAAADQRVDFRAAGTAGRPPGRLGPCPLILAAPVALVAGLFRGVPAGHRP